jgi:hypothetical protein
LVNKADLLAGVEAKLIATDDTDQRRKSQLPALENDNPPMPMNEDHPEHVELLRAGAERYYAPIANPDLI